MLLGRYDGLSVGSDIAWCDVHTLEIDTDANGDATFLLASSTDTADLRVPTSATCAMSASSIPITCMTLPTRHTRFRGKGHYVCMVRIWGWGW